MVGIVSFAERRNDLRFCGGACRGPRVPPRIHRARAEAVGPARSKRVFGLTGLQDQPLKSLHERIDVDRASCKIDDPQSPDLAAVDPAVLLDRRGERDILPQIHQRLTDARHRDPIRR